LQKFSNIFSLIFVLILAFASNSYSQNKLITKSVTDTFKINFQNKYLLSSISIVPFSEKVIVGKRLISGNDYEINFEHGFLTLSDTLSYSIFDSLFVSYQSLNLSLSKEYRNRTLVTAYDETSNDSISILRSDLSSLSSDDIFGKGIQRSGSITRGFTVGTNRDLTVNSGLRLQLSGRLSQEIEIVAALTDENTPIQPEGNTESLDELDKVFIEVRHPNAIGTFGDYDMKANIGEFGYLDRKLQGLKAEAILDNFNAAAALASSRGKFNTNQFQGQDGVQGPYRLTGANNERAIIIIAGSEKVYVDGEEMRRGENNQYVIDYAVGEITFTPNKLITSASRITIDFEYTDRQYQRNFFGTNSSASFFDERLNIKFSFMQEGDNQDSPIDLVLSENEIKILEEAGDDLFEAARDGATLVEPDSNGVRRGSYARRDTVINSVEQIYYLYSPGADSAIYNVVFSHVGAGNGSYRRESAGKYTFVGESLGSYLPIRLLPVPQLKQMGNLFMSAKPFSDLTLNLELAGSSWDKNRFSNLNDEDNYGYARNIFIQYDKQKPQLLGIQFNDLKLSFKDRYIEDRFTSLDRINSIEYNRDYNISGDETDDESLREIQLNVSPIEQFRIQSMYGKIKRGNSFSSDRFLNEVSLKQDKTYSLNYNIDFVSSKSNIVHSDWLRQKADANYTLGKIIPGFYFEAEDRKEFKPDSDSLTSLSLKFFEYKPYLTVEPIFGLGITAFISKRDEYVPLHGVMVKESEAFTHSYKLNYNEIKEFSSNLNITFRNKKYSPKLKELGFLDNETVLLRSESRFNFWDRFLDGNLFYEAATERAAKLEKIFIQVPVGQGSYRYLGDLNNNGIADEEEFEPTIYDGDFILTNYPTDELFPVINLKTSTRWKVDFEKMFDKSTLLSSALNALSTETFWRIEEKSSYPETEKIYLLNFNYFLNDSSTISGSNLFQQDFFLFKNSSELSFRFRYIQRKNLSQYSGGLEKGYFRERSLRIRFKLIKEVNNQTDVSNTTDLVTAPPSTRSSRSVSSNDIVSDFSYRPISNLEFGFKFQVGKIEDVYPDEATEINLNAQTIRLTLSFAGKGRLRFEAERSELNANTSTNFIPFEITNGKTIGKNYFWRLNFDYRIASNLQTTVSYDGRKQGESKIIHTMRAEARAYF